MQIWIKIFLLASLIVQSKAALSQEFEMPSYIYDITSCDFDSDGFKDILVSCPYSDTIAILYNDGVGNFNILYYNRSTGFILCGLIDADNLNDIITRDGYNLYFLKNLGNRLLSENTILLQIQGTYSATSVIDIDNDLLNDIVYTHTSGEYWGIFKNHGDLTFTNEIIQSGSSTTTPAVGFITDDSLPDIVLTYSAFNRSSVYVNNGDFNFSEVVLEETFIGEAFVMNIDNQGTDDFAFVNYYTNTVPLYKFIGNDQFELISNYYAAGVYAINSFLVGDYNQDGFDDFAITRGDWWNSSDSIYIYLNDHNWSFNLNQTLYIGVQTWYKSCAADLNGDAFPDIFMKGCNGSNILTILWNDGNGNFSLENPVGISEPPQQSAISISASPNPFSDQVNITVKAENYTDLDVAVYDILGRKIKGLHPGGWSPFLTWDGTDESGNLCPAGMYMIYAENKIYRTFTQIIKQ